MADHHSSSGGDRRRARRVADLVHGIDLAIAAVLLAFCAWVYYLTTQFEEVAALFAQDVPPEFLPRLLVWTIVALSVLLPFEHLIKPGGRDHFDKARSQPVAGMAYLTAGLLILIVASVKLIGTYFAIILVCIAMPVLWGERRWLIIVPFALLFPTLVMVIFAKAVGFWLGLTIIGSLVARYISRVVLWFKGVGAHVGIALGLAFLAAGIAEIWFGLAMIIGSYSMGLALSETDLKHQIESPMRQINNFLMPLFFGVIGMQADFTAFGGEGSSAGVATAIGFAAVLSLFGIFSKLFGSGVPALFVGFNRKGAWRVAVGMLPRGEVALIVAGIGLTSGVIERDVFGVAIVMTVVTTVLAPILLVPAFRGGSGLRAGEDDEGEDPAVPEAAGATTGHDHQA